MENNSGVFGGEEERMGLPPGFRFHPTDEELISCYLFPKVLDSNFSAAAIGEVDFTKCEPWDLPRRSKMGENEWYFFCLKDRKYPTGLRTNRATEAGYWKATGKDKEIYKGKPLVGMKKTLVFYKGRAPKGEKSNWVMHEYRLDGKLSPQNLPNSAKNEWVICRTFHKNSNGVKAPFGPSLLPPLTDSSPSLPHVSCFSSSMIIPQETPILNNPNYISHGFYQAPNPVYPPQINLFDGESQNPDRIFHENDASRSIMEENGGGRTGAMKTEGVTVSASQEHCLSSKVNAAEISSLESSYEMGLRGPFDDHHEDEGPSLLGGPYNTGSYWSWSYL